MGGNDATHWQTRDGTTRREPRTRQYPDRPTRVDAVEWVQHRFDFPALEKQAIRELDER
jgi:hypothetical protein